MPRHRVPVDDRLEITPATDTEYGLPAAVPTAAVALSQGRP